VTAGRYAVAQLSAMPESTADDYDDDHEPDIGDGWPDGWEDSEPDPAHPIDDADGAVRAPRRRRPAIEFFKRADGGLEHRVALGHPSARSGALKGESSWLEEWRDRLARVLIYSQPAAIGARTPREAYLCLTRMRQNYIAIQADVSEEWLSRHRADLISCPWGTVPLQFFTWGIEQSKAEHFQRLLDSVLDDPDASNSRLSRDAAGDESLRKLVPLARVLHDPGFRVARLRRNSCLWHDDAVAGSASDSEGDQDTRLREALKDRGMELYRFAIAGWKPKGGELWFMSA